MNAGPPSPRPDDEASDPLLAALRQRLGDYGQAPPPGAWAAIRQQLPPLPAPRPWWQRSRRLLPLLLLLLGIIGAGTVVLLRGQLAERNQLAKTSKPATTHFPRSVEGADYGSAKSSNQKSSFTESVSSAKSGAASALPSSLSASAEAAAEVTTPSHLARLPALASAAAPVSSAATRPKVADRSATNTAAPPLVAQRTARSKRMLKSSALSSAAREQPQSHARLARLPANRAAQTAQPVKRRLANEYAASPSVVAVAAAAATQPGHLSARPTRPSHPLTAKRNSKRHRAALLGATLPLAGHRTKTAATTPHLGAMSPPSASGAAWAAGPQAPEILPGQVDSLARRMAALGLLVALPQPTLITQPDSVWPPLPRARRWSVLVLAGPTLSYRTLGPAPTLVAQHPDFARLERPALGLGAQVQVRRVLSGRWALAAGLGYHEYATRLALSIVDSSTRSVRSVHQRDVYRVLTLPVQLSYAPSAPRGRLAWALFVGAEPSWYLGGRSTEGSDCGCQQQVYTVTSPRPYRTRSVAASLGLDFRYRLGEPASRWQWVVQPTARYLITPFVRSDATGFTQRRPFSLGLLTGLSWDLR